MGIEAHRGEVIGSELNSLVTEEISTSSGPVNPFFPITLETWDVGMTLDPSSNRFTNNFLLFKRTKKHETYVPITQPPTIINSLSIFSHL